jgi:hypothetical protein
VSSCYSTTPAIGTGGDDHDDDDDDDEGSDLGEREFVQLIGRHSIFFTEKIPRKITHTRTMEINQTDSEQHESLIFKDIRNQNDTAKHYGTCS